VPRPALEAIKERIQDEKCIRQAVPAAPCNLKSDREVKDLSEFREKANRHSKKKGM
jgi:hypothetical protein